MARVAASEGLEAEVRCDYALEPTMMDAGVIAAIEAATREEGVEALRMCRAPGTTRCWSDAAPRPGCFVPSRDGISHSPAEWTETADCELGARVLARTLAASGVYDVKWKRTRSPSHIICEYSNGAPSGR